MQLAMYRVLGCQVCSSVLGLLCVTASVRSAASKPEPMSCDTCNISNHGVIVDATVQHGTACKLVWS